MKNLFFILIALLTLSMMAFAQPGGKQPLPNFVGDDSTFTNNRYGTGWPIGQWKGGIQGVKSAMLHGPHDFTPDSGKTFTVDTVSPGVFDTVYSALKTGRYKGLCSYCHAAHVPKTGVANPLWSRKSTMGGTFGKYDNPSSLDATVFDPGAGQQDNYSSLCMSCHDGSIGIFANAKYESGSSPNQSDADISHVPHVANVVNGEFDLAHVHPVNFDYNAVQALVPEELYPAVDPVSAVWKGYASNDGTFGTGTAYTTVRLFNGWMQCSSCHNPHMSSGIGTVITSDWGKRCVACHKK